MKKALFTLLLGISAALITANPVRADHTNTHTNITCDFGPLADAIDDLEISDIQAPNDNARRGRLNSLRNAAANAEQAAETNDLHEVLDALEHIAKKVGDERNAWVTSAAGADIEDALDDLLDCLADVTPPDDDDDDDNGNVDNGCFDELATQNRQNVELDPGAYNCDLVLRGNNNSVTGADNGTTVIHGDLVVTGNRNVLRDVRVLGTITIRGNNNRLVDVDYTGTVDDRGNNNTF